MNVLHNDIKSNNIMFFEKKVKITDFWKATYISKPIIYNLTPSDAEKYNLKHQYLAHKLWNIPNSKQTELTDTYSVGYMFKYISYYQHFDFLYSIVRKMIVFGRAKSCVIF